MNDSENSLNVALDNSTYFQYRASLLGKASDANGNARSLKNTKIVAPLKYLSNFFRSPEISLINCKIHLELNWNNNYVIYVTNTYAGGDNANNRKTTFKIRSTKLYVPIATLSTKDNVNLSKQLNEGFKRSVYWNEYKSKIETKEADANNLKRFPHNASFQRVNRLFVLAYQNTENGKARLEETVIENIFFQE